jgi:hypothetical protein
MWKIITNICNNMKMKYVKKYINIKLLMKMTENDYYSNGSNNGWLLAKWLTEMIMTSNSNNEEILLINEKLMKNENEK